MQGDNIEESLIKVSSYIDINVFTSGNITCEAQNKINTTSETRKFLVCEVPGCFGVKDADDMWFSEGQLVTVDCYASLYYFTDIKWYRNGSELNSKYQMFEII